MNDNTSTPAHMDDMSDNEVKKIIAHGYKLLDKRKREYEKSVKEQIKKMATDAGINVSFSNKLPRKSKS